MGWTLSISPHGRPLLVEEGEGAAPVLSAAAAERLDVAFHAGDSAGLLHLATAELQTVMPAPLAYARDFARRYLTRLCRTGVEGGGAPGPVEAPAAEELAFVALQAPPMKGLEYLNAAVLHD